MKPVSKRHFPKSMLKASLLSGPVECWDGRAGMLGKVTALSRLDEWGTVTEEMEQLPSLIG